MAKGKTPVKLKKRAPKALTRLKKPTSRKVSPPISPVLKQIEAQKELILLKQSHFLEFHKHTMKQLEYTRMSEQIAHDHEMERQRTKSDEIRKMYQQKAAARYEMYPGRDR